MCDSQSCDAGVHHFCRSNWRQAGYLTLAGACLSLGLFISVQGLQESLSEDTYSSPLLDIGGLGHLWPFGPILILVGIVIGMAALLMRKRAVDMELQKQDTNQGNGDIYVLEKEEPPEKQAVFFEPIIIL